jgi:Protein of unknown function (DUF3987)
MLSQWERIPDELRYCAKWCVSAPDKSPYQPNGHRASVVDSRHWHDFYQCAIAAESWRTGLGFVLSESDEFTCIDLDVKDSTSKEDLDRYWAIVKKFDSYTEKSQSGRGLHIWVKGKTGLGARRDGVEVYSQQRFIICTGDVLAGFNKAIEPRQELLDELLSEMRRDAQSANIPLENVEQTISDEELWARAQKADNGDKFRALWMGQWKSIYPSQSEADLSLLSMLCFYSKSNEQVIRFFRGSALGKREKASKNLTYLNRTLRVVRSREKLQSMALAAVSYVMPNVEKKTIENSIKFDPLDWPPGATGYLANWLYDISPRPVKEIAIATALAILAGLYGKLVNIPQSGLNLYVVVVAKSAIGKEAIHSGISAFQKEMMKACPREWAVFNEFASGPALVKAVGVNPCFLNVCGEWGRRLQKIANDQADSATSSLRTAMTNLYQKSASNAIVGGIGYSDKEKNAASTKGIAYSMIGETTPDTFYDSLTNTMMQDGFMSRFLIIEYNGLRPVLNPAPFKDFDHNLLNRFQSHQPPTLDSFDSPTIAHFDDEAREIVDSFDLLCDDKINNTLDESQRQMWNRAHLKVLRISALLGCADSESINRVTVTKEHANWALSVVTRDIAVMSRKLDRGEVGDGDLVRMRKLMSIVNDYCENEYEMTNGNTREMHKDGIVSRSYLQHMTRRSNVFLNHRAGAVFALDTAIKNLADSGYVIEVFKGTAGEKYGYHGKCYKVQSIGKNII